MTESSKTSNQSLTSSSAVRLRIPSFHANKLLTSTTDNVNDPYSDDYTTAFWSMAEHLDTQADEALSKDDTKSAIALYKRASTVLRLSRFPYIGTPKKREAYEKQKKVYEKGMKLWTPVMKEVIIPHKYAKGEDGKEIPLYVRIPMGSTGDKPVPVMFLITGLDGHRPDNFEVSKAEHRLNPRLTWWPANRRCD